MSRLLRPQTLTKAGQAFEVAGKVVDRFTQTAIFFHRSLRTLDAVLPRPEGLPFTADAKRLAYVYANR